MLNRSYNSKNQSRVSRGFTLIELLVVIAIIAILAAILFPAFARARENARRASCQSNLKQIALGIFQYTQDYDEKFPTYYTNTAYVVANPQPYAWSDELQPYIKSLQIYQCPSESSTPTSNASAAGYNDYGINLRLIYGDISTDGTSGAAGAKSLSVLTQPSVTVMMFDYTSTNATANFSVGCPTRPCSAATPLATYPVGPPMRHLEGMNYSFTDGHVKWLKSQNTTTSSVVLNDQVPGNGSQPTFSLIP